MTFTGIWTSKGIQKMANAGAGGTAISITHLLLGDGNGTIPTVLPSQTALVNEKWRGNVNTVTVEADSTVVVETVIPYNIGGFFIREWALLDTENDIVAIGPHAEFYKPLLIEGSGAELVEQIKLPISSAGQISVYVSSAALATRKYVDDKLNTHDKNIGSHADLIKLIKESNPLLYPSAFVTLYEQSPPSGFYVRNGGLITNADTTVPKLWEALQKPENAWKCKTQAQWTALSNATPWSGIGGVPFFVVDMAEKTIRLPDTRGMHEEGSGFDSLIVGGVKKDMTRNFSGTITALYSDDPFSIANGVFNWDCPASGSLSGMLAVPTKGQLSISASRQVPTGPVNRPRSFGVLHCVYAGIQE